MLVLALPAKSFQLYFNFIQSAYPNALSRIFVQNGRGWNEKEIHRYYQLFAPSGASFREAGRGEARGERDRARDFQFPQQRRLSHHSALNRG